ncbi:MAG: translation initiation factor IF-2 [Christensenellaceae bacterium]
MEEKRDNTIANIKKIKSILDAKKIDEVLKDVKESKKYVADLSKKLGAKQSQLKKDRLEAERVAREAQEAEKMAETAPETVISTEIKSTETKTENKTEIIVEAVVEEKVAKPQKTESETVAESVATDKVASQGEVEAKEQKQASQYRQPKEQPLQEVQRPQIRKEFVPNDRNQGYDRNQRRPNDRQGYQRPQGDRPQNGFNRQGDRPQNGFNRQGGQQGGGFNRSAQGAQNGANRGAQSQQKPFNKPQKPQEVAFVPKDNNRFTPKKKQNDKNYDDKHALNKKQLTKGNLSVEDFDENKSGYRKLRTKKTARVKEEQRIRIEKAVVNKEIIPLKELSEKLGVSAVEITKILFKEGIIKNINDSIDFDTAEFVAMTLNIELELKLDKTAEDVLSEGFSEETDDPAKYVSRPPIVTVMGHVDHGKTSLLDRIRQTNVTAGEAGGITQHIGAYSVSVNNNKITFLDTPGHAAFTAMRARGAQVTDIAVIVIAADDGIMPQTIEAINHAKAANVSIIVAANKIDKPHANIERVRQQLTEHEILVEDWGGDVMLVPVSAKTGEGVDKLLDSILLIAEMRELKANPDRKAKGAVVEAKLDKGKGPVATIIVQNGTLKMGDNIVAGTIVGKVRAMFDDKGRMVKEAGPSMAVSVLGLESVPNAGDIIFAVDQEKLTRLVAQERKNKEREEMIRQQQKVSLDELFSKIEGGDLKRLNIIIKADVQGSVEAVKQSLEELSNDTVKVSVIHAGVGAINETDVMLADSSNSIIIGFNVRPDSNAKALSERSRIDIKLYRIIYEAIADVEKAMKGLLAPRFTDVYMGKAEVRETFKITGVGMVAGCYVTEGKIVRSGKLRIYREDVMICEGNVLQLKRFKDDVKEVNQGFECGISIENFNDVKVGDFIESYIVEESKND